VTKFGKVSVFSDLNNLKDISMDYRYMDICGITDKELHENFDGDVALLGERNGLTKEECYVKLKEQYDGYHFDYDTVGLYNPFSIFNTLSKLKFSDYWFETGTPSFLVYLLKHSNYRLDRITEEQVSGDLLNSIDSMSRNPIPVIYQSGYLTIKGYDKEFGIYRLGFPNKEVENGFIKYLLPFYTPVTEQESSFIITSFVMDIRQGNVDSFMQRLQSMFADTDYKIVGWEQSLMGIDKMHANQFNNHQALFPLHDIIPKVDGRKNLGAHMFQHLRAMEVENHLFTFHSEVFIGSFGKQFSVLLIGLMTLQIEIAGHLSAT
jgi:hypothetical protein